MAISSLHSSGGYVITLKLNYKLKTLKQIVWSMFVSHVNITVEQRAWVYLLFSKKRKGVRTKEKRPNKLEKGDKEKRPTHFCQRTWQEQNMYAKNVFIEPRDLRRSLFRTIYSQTAAKLEVTMHNYLIVQCYLQYRGTQSLGKSRPGLQLYRNNLRCL